MSIQATMAPPRRRLRTLPGITGIGYTLSWIAGLLIAAPSPKLTASGPAVLTAFAGHGPAVLTQFVLTEGLPAVALAVISVTLARAARRSGAGTAGLVAGVAGMAAAVISLLQFALGAILAGASTPGTAHLLFASVNRLDGVKMIAIALLAASGAASGLLPRWLRYTGIALAVAIAASGVVYLLLLQGMALAAGPALVLLLVFVTGTGITLGRAGQ